MPTRVRAAAMLALVVLTSLVVCDLPAAARADVDPSPTTVTYVTVSGVGSDFITGDRSYVWGPGGGTVSVTGSPAEGYVRVHVSGGTSGSDFDLTFEAADDQPLVAGEYDDAQRSPFNDAGHPGLAVSGNHHGCNRLTGEFIVHRIEDDLSRLSIAFEQHCENGTSALFGEVEINAPVDERGDLDGIVTVPNTVPWPAIPARTASTVPVLVHNTGTTPVTTGPATLAGDADVTIVDDACGTLAPGGSCYVQVRYAPTLAGSHGATLSVPTTAAPLTVALTGTAYAEPVTSTITTNRTFYPYASTARVTAHLSGSYVDPTVSVYARSGSAPRELLTTAPVDADGNVVVTASVKQSTRFIVEWTDGTRRGSASTDVGVRAPTVRITHRRRHYFYGDSSVLTMTVTGASGGQFAVYRRVGDDEPVLERRVPVDSSGTGLLTVRARINVLYVARWEDDGVVRASAVSRFPVRAGVTLTPRGSTGSSGRYAVYRPGSRITVQGKVSPAKPGRCVRFAVQVLVRDWQDLGQTGCVHLSDRSTARVYLDYDKALLGRNLRLVVHYGGDRLNGSHDSGWVYARYGR